MSLQFTLDEAEAATQYTGGFGEQYPVEDGHSAANAIDAAISDSLITGPDGYWIGVDLLANLDGELDGYRILVSPAARSCWLASEVLNVMPGTEPNTMDVLREAITMANELLTVAKEKDLTEALGTTPPGYAFSDRQLLNMTRVALARVFTGQTQDESPKLREAARQALARLEGWTRLPDSDLPALARQRITSLSGLHGMLESAGYSPVRGIWTAEVLWDGDCLLTSVPISGIEPEYTGSAPAETAAGLDRQQWVHRRAAEFRRDFTDNPEARARARQLNDEANTGQEGN